MEYLYKILLTLGGTAAGCIVGYLTAYFRQKAKNKALKKDIAQLEEEKQKVQTKYAKEIEELKNKNALQGDLKRYKYQDKRDAFTKFFTQLDEFHDGSLDSFFEQHMPIHKKLFENFISGNEAEMNEALVDFNSSISTLSKELMDQQRKFLGETNTVRLFASPELEKLLDEMTAITEGFASYMMNKFHNLDKNPNAWLEGNAFQLSDGDFCEKVETIKNLQQSIRKQMKKELNEM